MKLFNITNDKLKSISTNPFKLEKDIQTLIEKNIDVLFNLQFVKSEFVSFPESWPFKNRVGQAR